MTKERQKKIDEWCKVYCQKCAENLDRDGYCAWAKMGEGE